MTDNTSRNLWEVLGPGILFAGAAVGVSHLVQATRAGAAYGMSLLLFVLLANLMKYPAFRFGPHYAAATGTSLLAGYRHRGTWALLLYALVTVATMFTVQAAVSFVTAGLLKYLFDLSASPLTIVIGLNILCAAILALGKFTWLDRIGKVVVGVFTVGTLVATVCALPKLSWTGAWWPDLGSWTTSNWIFVIALMGWMPSAIDVSVWQSLWTLARAKQTGRTPTVRESSVDFHVGYIGTVVLAVCFVILGAAVMHGSGIELSPKAHVFAGQLIDLYGVTLGEWSKPILGASALLVMFSTTLTVIDGFPRALASLSDQLRDTDDTNESPLAYWGAILILGVGSACVLSMFISSLKAMVDIATTLSCLTAPVLSWLNHQAVTGSEVPIQNRPSRRLLQASYLAIVTQGLLALAYLWARFGN